MTDKFKQKLLMKKQMEVQELTMLHSVQPLSRSSKAFDIAKPQASYEDGSLAGTTKLNEHDSFAKIIHRIESNNRIESKKDSN